MSSFDELYITMKKVLIFGKIHNCGIKILLDDCEVMVKEMAEQDPQIFDELPDTDAIIVRMTKITRDIVEAAPRLKVVARHGVGFEAVDVEALTDFGVPLTITGDVNSIAVAEHTLALMLSLAKQIIPYDQAVRKNNFNIRDRFSSSELAGKIVLIAGFGRIGRATAQRAQAFGMKVQVADPFLRGDEVESQNYTYVPNFQEGLLSADYVCIHVPKTPQTENLISFDELKAMKDTACIVNVSRGGIINEKALVAALENGWIRGAALDVFDPEPPRMDHPILEFDNVVVSPHCGAFTEECAQRMATACAQSVLDSFRGRFDTNLVVNKEVLKT